MRRLVVSGLVAVACVCILGARVHAQSPCEERELCVDNGDGTVTDLSSGLMWLKDSGDGFNDGFVGTWNEAVSWASDLVFAGYDDWRLPSALHAYTGIPDLLLASPHNEWGYLYGFTWDDVQFGTPGAGPVDREDILPWVGYRGYAWTGTWDRNDPGQAAYFNLEYDGFTWGNYWTETSQTLLAVPVRRAFWRTTEPLWRVGNDNVTEDPAADQNEPMIAINPTDDRRLVVGYNDVQGDIGVGWSWSNNGGGNWTKGGRISIPGYQYGADPVVAFDSAGTAYMAGLVFNPCNLQGCLGVDGSIFLAKSSDGGRTFDDFQKIVVQGDGTTTYMDKPWLAVNPGFGHVYLAWVQRANAWNVGGEQEMSIWFTRSLDGGATFEEPYRVSPERLYNQPIVNHHGPQIAVGDRRYPGDNLDVHVAWHTVEKGTRGTPSWEPPQIKINTAYALGFDFEGTWHVTTIDHAYPAKFISMGVSRGGGINTVYIAYTNRPTEDGDLDIYVANDWGPGWNIRRVNDDPEGNGRDQYWPSLSVAPNGRVDVIWYDQRENGAGLDVYYSSSQDYGVTWSRNTRVTNTTWAGTANFSGDYHSIASLNERADAVWMDNRSGTQEIYKSTLLIANQTIAAKPGNLQSIAQVPEDQLDPAGKPGATDFPFGFLSLRVEELSPGATTTVTITTPEDISSPAQYWATDPADPGSWVDLTPFIGDDDGDNVLTLTLTDEGIGDHLYGQPGTIGTLGGIGVAGESIPVQDLNGIPGIQCPGSNCTDGNYAIHGLDDVVRVALAGMHHDDADNIGMQDCNSDARWTILESHPGFFVGSCTADGACDSVQHAWRLPDDDAGMDTFLELLGLPAIENDPFCNGDDFGDDDPIRRACLPEEDVCRGDGTLGFVLSIVPGPGRTELCQFGVFQWLQLPFTRFECPQGINPLFGLCLQPKDAQGNFGCVNSSFNVPFGTPTATDGRLFNLWPLDENGIAPIVGQRELLAAYDRIHTVQTVAPGANVCREPDANDRIACLTEASPCSVGTECSVGNPCEGIACDDFNECTSDMCDPLAGTCSNPPVPDGMDCDSGSGTCEAGVCIVPSDAPLLTAIDATLITLNQCGIPNSSTFRYTVDYTDPNGDVTSSGTRVFVDLAWANGDTLSYESDSTFNSVSGDGYTGSVQAYNCLEFGVSAWVDVTVTIYDAAGNVSNSPTTRVQKPSGAY